MNEILLRPDTAEAAALLASPVMRRHLTVHPIIRPIVLGAFQAYNLSFNLAQCCLDLARLAERDVRLPDGVSLTNALCARHAQSVYETTIVLALDMADLELDETSRHTIATTFGGNIAKLVAGTVESRGAPSREAIAAAAASLNNPEHFAASLLAPFAGG